jgi:glycosyltransferase involved in cell wall biosynthesis
LSCSLIVVLPIHNAASLLRREVEDLLEVLSETASDFELLIVDVGSTDDVDLAAELAQEFPQVRSIRKDPKQSLTALVDGIRASTKAEVIVHGGLCEVGDLDRMWRHVAKTNIVPALAMGPKGLSGNLLAQLANWGERLRGQKVARHLTRPANFIAHLRELASAG